MAAVVIEVIVHVVAVSPLRSAVPTVGTASPAVPPIARTTSSQAGQRLRDGFGRIRFRGFVLVGGHPLILHAT